MKAREGCKALLANEIMIWFAEKVPANSVPAAAVIQRVQALFGIIGRKAYIGGNVSLM
jgi:hypothetical protein